MIRQSTYQTYEHDPTPHAGPTITDVLSYNLLYCNNNPDPENICAICAADIGRVFIPGTEPYVPRHDYCYCYYVPTKRAPSPMR